MANSRYVSYLDDDNVWLPSHLRRLHEVIQGKAYAFAPRLLVDDVSGETLCEDVWDSRGPNRGRFAPHGGFVDPSCLAVDKLILGSKIGRWAELRDGDTRGEGSFLADRWFFAGIRELPCGAVEEPTVKYFVRTNNILRQFAYEKRPAL